VDVAVAAGQTNRRKDRQPDTDRYIDPAPHNMRAVSIKLKSIKLCFFLFQRRRSHICRRSTCPTFESGWARGTALVNYLHYLITKCVQFKSHASEDSIGDFEYFDVIGVWVRPFLTMYKLANNSPAVLQTTYSCCTGPNGTSP